MIQIYCKFKSFENSSISLAVNYLDSITMFVNILSIQKISLPKNIKQFTVIKSPHKYKKSREQFQYIKIKKCLILKTEEYFKASLFIQLIKDCEFPGVEMEIRVTSADYFIRSCQE